MLALPQEKNLCGKELKKHLESRMLGNLHVRFGVGARVRFPGLHHLGAVRFARFKRMLAAVDKMNFADAAKEMMDSRWARQVGKRARTLAAMMRTGKR